jgi:hypothetical protein
VITPAYRILRYRASPCILCLACNRISHNPNDIAQHYCGVCGFLDDLPELLRCDNTEGRAPGLLLEGPPVVCPACHEEDGLHVPGCERDTPEVPHGGIP